MDMDSSGNSIMGGTSMSFSLFWVGGEPNPYLVYYDSNAVLKWGKMIDTAYTVVNAVRFMPVSLNIVSVLECGTQPGLVATFLPDGTFIKAFIFTKMPGMSDVTFILANEGLLSYLQLKLSLRCKLILSNLKLLNMMIARPLQLKTLIGHQ